MNAWQLFKHWIYQNALGIDQQANAFFLGLFAIVLAVFTGKPQNPAYVDESLSAHAHRAEGRGKRWGLLSRPFIDWLFSWQKPDPTITDDYGNVVQGHCERAYYKEILRRNLPPAYREKGPTT